MQHLNDYQREVEQVYLTLMSQLIRQGQTTFDIAVLLAARIQSPFHHQLVERAQALHLDSQMAWSKEESLLRNLIRYIQAVQYIAASTTDVSWDCLEFQRQTLQIQPETARWINSLFITNRSDPPAITDQVVTDSASEQERYRQQLEEYDHELINEIKKAGPELPATSRQRLKFLQTKLSIPERDIIRPEEIRSAHNRIDYTKLWRLLQARNWRQANELTWKLMMAAIAQESGALSIKDIQDFPCQDLHTIDYLWMRFSQNRFCFSTQRQIWWWCQDPALFVRRVGWVRKDHSQHEVWQTTEHLVFSLQAERGHLPFLPLAIENRQYTAFTEALLNRLEHCPIVAEVTPKITPTKMPSINRSR